MKKKIALLVVLVSFCVLSAQGEKFLKSKVVYEGTEIPVAEITVEIKKLNLITKTDEHGVFSFKKELPEGEHVISVMKEGFVPGKKLIKKIKGEKIDLLEIEITLTKREKRKRKKIREKEIALGRSGGCWRPIIPNRGDSIRGERKGVTELEREAREEKKARNEALNLVEEEEFITENQVKYATILGVDVKGITHKKLYNFIDEWMGTPHLTDGETEAGIDCSSFTQRLFVDSYGSEMYIERTVQKQFDSEQTELFKDKQYLREGDLIFFGKDSFSIMHVGVYLQNNKFIHSTAREVEGPSGVKISDLSDPFWSRLYFSSGRRLRSR